MKLVIEKTLKNNNYEIKLSVADVTTEDTDLISDFGEVQVNIAGKLEETVHNTETGLDETTVIANLGDSFKYLPSEFPVTKTFTKAQYGADVEKIATTYITTIKTRTQDAITALKAKQDTFSGIEEIVL